MLAMEVLLGRSQTISQLKVLGGELHQVTQKSLYKVNIQGVQIEQWFHVVQGIQQSVILGMDFLQQHSVVLDFSTNLLMLGDCQIKLGSPGKHTCLIRTVGPTNIDPSVVY